MTSMWFPFRPGEGAARQLGVTLKGAVATGCKAWAAINNVCDSAVLAKIGFCERIANGTLNRPSATVVRGLAR